MSHAAVPPERQARSPSVTLLALVLVFLPYLHAFWIHVSGQEVSVAELFLYPLLVGGAGIVLISLLLRYLFQERLAQLNRRPARWFTDVSTGVLLCIASFVLMIAHSALFAPLLPRPSEPPQVVQTLLRALSENPLLLALWLGPVVWIGVAAFEELSRVFLLDRLWKLWPGRTGRWSAVVLSALVWALVHIYQGVSSVVSISLLGLMYAAYYLRFGRVWPLIIAHALFDSIQVGLAAGGLGAQSP